jgi:hypothetical protein
MSLNYTTITGTFRDGQGNPLTLSPVFAPSATVLAGGIPAVTPEGPVQAQVISGTLENSSGGPLTLLATDQAGVVPEGQTAFWFWTVSFPGTQLPSFSFFLPSSPSTVDISKLTQAGGTQYLPLAGGSLTGALVPAVVALTDAATVAVNAALGNAFRLLMTSGVGATRILGNPSNPADGQRIDVAVTQDVVGSRLLTYGSAYDFGAAGTPTLSTAASALDILGFIYYASKGKWCFVGAPGGF